MKKILFTVLVFAIGGLSWFFVDGKRDNEQIVKIGVILPMTGNNSYMGKTMKEGLEFYAKYAKPTLKYKLIYEDDQLTPAKTISAANKLVAIDNVDALITGTSLQAAVVAPIAEKNKVLHIALASDLAFTKHDYNYSMTPSAEDEGKVLLGTLQEKGYKNVAMISSEEPYSNLVVDNLKKHFGDYGLSLVYEAKFTAPQRDFKLMFAYAETKKPDIYILQSWMPEIDILVKQLKEANSSADFTSLYAFFVSENLAMYEGKFALNVGTKDKVLREAFFKEYGKYPEQMSSVAYGILSILVDILQKSDQEMDMIVSENDSLFGPLELEGKMIKYDPIIEVIKDGKPVPLEEDRNFDEQ